VKTTQKVKKKQLFVFHSTLWTSQIMETQNLAIDFMQDHNICTYVFNMTESKKSCLLRRTEGLLEKHREQSSGELASFFYKKWMELLSLSHFFSGLSRRPFVPFLSLPFYSRLYIFHLVESMSSFLAL